MKMTKLQTLPDFSKLENLSTPSMSYGNIVYYSVYRDKATSDYYLSLNEYYLHEDFCLGVEDGIFAEDDFDGYLNSYETAYWCKWLLEKVSVESTENDFQYIGKNKNEHWFSHRADNN